MREAYFLNDVEYGCSGDLNISTHIEKWITPSGCPAALRSRKLRLEMASVPISSP